MKNIGEILKERRNKLGFSQQEVADMIGVKQRTYGMYEDGSRSPKHKTALAIEKALKIPNFIEQLFYSDSETEQSSIANETVPDIKIINSQQDTIEAQRETIQLQRAEIRALRERIRELEREKHRPLGKEPGAVGKKVGEK